MITIEAFSLRIRRIFQADYKSEGFGDYEIPREILMLEDIEDLSWHNDASPSFGKYWDTGEDGAVQIRIYVQHQDPDRREFDAERFVLQVFTTDCEASLADVVEEAMEPLITPSGDKAQGGVTTLAITDDVMETVRLFVTAVVTINQILRRGR